MFFVKIFSQYKLSHVFCKKRNPLFKSSQLLKWSIWKYALVNNCLLHLLYGIISLISSKKMIELCWKPVMQHLEMFVCLGFYVPFENFSLVWRRHHYW